MLLTLPRAIYVRDVTDGRTRTDSEVSRLHRNVVQPLNTLFGHMTKDASYDSLAGNILGKRTDVTLQELHYEVLLTKLISG